MTIPFPFQVAGARAIYRFGGRALLADQAGLGKSLTSLLYLVRNWDGNVPCVVVCPATLKWNWQREALIHFGLRAQVLEGTHPSPPGGRLPDICVVNYDILGRRGGDHVGEGWLSYLKSIQPRLVIIDESQNLCDPTTLKTRWVQSLCASVPHVVCLSGTPFTNRPKELYPTLNLLRPDLFGSWSKYAHRYCGPTKRFFGWTYDGATHLDELHSILTENLMLRRRKEDVLQDLPPKTRSIVPLELSKKDRRDYDQASKDLLTWLADKEPSRLHGALRSEALVRVTYLKMLAGRLKMPQAMPWVEGHLEESGGKIILFGIHKQVIATLQERFRRQCVVVKGGTPLRERQRAVDQFQNDDRIRVFIGSDAAETGITLTAADSVALLEMGWTPGEMTQKEDRAHRISQMQRVSCYYPVARGTCEERNAEILQEKQIVLSSALDGGMVDGDLDVFDRLLEEMRSGA